MTKIEFETIPMMGGATFQPSFTVYQGKVKIFTSQTFLVSTIANGIVNNITCHITAEGLKSIQWPDGDIWLILIWNKVVE